MKKLFYNILWNFSEKTSLPLNEICKDFSATISGRREVVFEGVKKIDTYSEERIVLSLCREYVVIYGKNLLLKSFYKTALCIGGIIDRIEFVGESAYI